jgi:hypothetical protein
MLPVDGSVHLCIIMDAPWYVQNMVTRKDLQISTVKHEISRYSYHYSKRLSVHPNGLIVNIQEPPETRRLRKNLLIDLPTRFNMYEGRTESHEQKFSVK